MRKSNVGIDLDGVVCNIYDKATKVLKEMYNIDRKDGQENYMWEQEYGLTTQQVSDVFAKIGDMGGYRDADLYPGARKTLVKLSRQYNIYYVTVRDFYPAIKKDTFYWLDKNKLPYFRVVFTRSKYKVAEKEEFQFFMDDCTEMCNRVAKTGVPTFLWKQPWNKREDTDALVKILTDWTQVEQILITE